MIGHRSIEFGVGVFTIHLSFQRAVTTPCRMLLLSPSQEHGKY